MKISRRNILQLLPFVLWPKPAHKQHLTVKAVAPLKEAHYQLELNIERFERALMRIQWQEYNSMVLDEIRACGDPRGYPELTLAGVDPCVPNIPRGVWSPEALAQRDSHLGARL